jgi:hypothetical protein
MEQSSHVLSMKGIADDQACYLLEESTECSVPCFFAQIISFRGTFLSSTCQPVMASTNLAVFFFSKKERNSVMNLLSSTYTRTHEQIQVDTYSGPHRTAISRSKKIVYFHQPRSP